ncbi:hypothetical protein J6590_096785 [Homalodisca vitripennis]|nr:hypothetical protein J6590_037456 [Homalodisca vitripennis]KAG8319200.1 hypothetical protein J6590_096785 [Homalodisca vitripennis]
MTGRGQSNNEGDKWQFGQIKQQNHTKKENKSSLSNWKTETNVFSKTLLDVEKPMQNLELEITVAPITRDLGFDEDVQDRKINELLVVVLM